jgi:hypothetical protein
LSGFDGKLMILGVDDEAAIVRIFFVIVRSR